MNRWITSIFLLLLAGLLEVSFFTLWPSPVNHLQLLLCLNVLLAVLVGLPPALWWALGSGLLLGMHSPNQFGVNIFGMLGAAIAAYYLIHFVLTNRSLYATLAVGAVATLLYNALLAVGLLAGREASVSSLAWGTLTHLVMNELFLAITYFAFLVLARKFVTQPRIREVV